jgi:hypothetical protein
VLVRARFPVNLFVAMAEIKMQKVGQPPTSRLAEGS